MIAWRGPGFDPNIVDETAIRKALNQAHQSPSAQDQAAL
jgi:hypothetical protein